MSDMKSGTAAQAKRARYHNRKESRAMQAQERKGPAASSPPAFYSEEMRQACRKARGYQAKAPRYCTES